MLKYAPIVIFCYNRPSHLKNLIESIKQNKETFDSDLYVFSDGAKNEEETPLVEEVRKIISSISGFKTINLIFRKKNIGLAQNVIEGVSEVIEKYGKIIVLEDDLNVSPNFLSYMNEALDYYINQKKVFSISGYCLPIEIPKDYTDDVFAFYRINSWGWATWIDRWNLVDWEVCDFEFFLKDRKKRRKFNYGGEDCSPMLLRQMTGKINSWAIRFNFASYKNDGITIYPVKSKVVNLGADGSGTHVKQTNTFETKIDRNQNATKFNMPNLNEKIVRNYCNFFRKSAIRKAIYTFDLYKYLIFKR